MCLRVCNSRVDMRFGDIHVWICWKHETLTKVVLSKIVLCFSCGRFSCRKFKGHLPPSYLVDQLWLSRVSEKHACPNMSP